MYKLTKLEQDILDKKVDLDIITLRYIEEIVDRLNTSFTLMNDIIPKYEKIVEKTLRYRQTIHQIATMGITAAQKYLLFKNPEKSIQPSVKQYISMYRNGNNLAEGVKKTWFTKKPTQTKIILETLDRLHTNQEYPPIFECIDGVHHIKHDVVSEHFLIQDYLLNELYAEFEVTAKLKNEYYLYKYTFDKNLISEGSNLADIALANVVHDYVYYGQTIDLEKRHSDHFKPCDNPTKKEFVFAQFGSDSFKYEHCRIIASKEEINVLEQSLFNGSPRTLNNSDRLVEFEEYDHLCSVRMPLRKEVENYLFEE